jgi:membrane protease YdiL (CAAX protease family)
VTDPSPPPAWQPPPPPPPPAGPPPASGPPAGRQPVGPRQALRSDERTPLDVVGSPYGVVVALLTVAIFIAPNLLVLAADGFADGPGTTALPEGPELIVGLVITIALQLFVFALSLLPLLIAGRPFRRLFGPTRSTGTMWAIALAVGIVTVIVTYAVNAIFVLTFGDGEAVEQQVLDIALSGGAATALAILLAVVLAPVTEEIVFRGVLLRALAAKVGMWPAAILSSAVFAVIHFEVLFSQPLALVGLFTVGLLLAIAYHRTGSLLVPMVGHAVFNGVSVGLALLANQLDLASAWWPTLPGLGG